MKKWAVIAGFFASTVAAEQPVRLADYEVFPLDVQFSFEPSGLTLKAGRLFTVCDDANNIYEIIIKQDQAEVQVHRKLDVKPLAAMNLDLEGITHVGDDFVLISEVHHKLVWVKEEHIQWVPDLGSVYQDAYENGLFQVHNAGLEAISYLGDDTFLLAVERQPRGLIEVQMDSSMQSIVTQKNQVFTDHKYPPTGDRQPDMTGLFVHDEALFGLHRNAYLINELIKNEDGRYEEGRAWSYEHIVKHPDHAYADMTFGHAEGLAVDDDYFYLVLDNNNIAKANNRQDKRPLLIRAKRQ